MLILYHRKVLTSTESSRNHMTIKAPLNLIWQPSVGLPSTTDSNKNFLTRSLTRLPIKLISQALNKLSKTKPSTGSSCFLVLLMVSPPVSTKPAVVAWLTPSVAPSLSSIISIFTTHRSLLSSKSVMLVWLRQPTSSTLTVISAPCSHSSPSFLTTRTLSSTSHWSAVSVVCS